MKIEGEVVTFKSNSVFFTKEKSGRKPNTVRLLSEIEWADIRCTAPPIKKISIVDVHDSSKRFFRMVTDISLCGEMVGMNLVVFSWEHKED